MNNDVLIIPEQRYHTNAPWMDPEADPKDEVPKDHDIPDDAWFSGDDGLDRIPVGAEINRVEFPVADGTAQVTVLLAGDLPDMSRFSIDAVLIDPNRKYYGLDHPLADSVVVRDDYFEMLRINEPAPGRWTLEICTAMGRQAEQTGAFTIFASTKPSAARHTLEVRAVPRLASTTDTVRVSILPTYQYALRDLEALGLQVIDPVGAGWSVAVEANPKGGYTAEISGLAYKGVHTLQVLARSGPDTYHDPGRALGGGAHSIPSFLVGQTAAFFVTDGIDVSPPRLDDRSFD